MDTMDGIQGRTAILSILSILSTVQKRDSQEAPMTSDRDRRDALASCHAIQALVELLSDRLEGRGPPLTAREEAGSAARKEAAEVDFAVRERDGARVAARRGAAYGDELARPIGRTPVKSSDFGLQ